MPWPDLANIAAEYKAVANRGNVEADRRRWASDPVAFHDEVFGSPAWEKQKELMYAVRDKPRVGCKAAHKLSKTRTAASLGMWWCELHPLNGKVITTAVTASQIRNIIWDEVHNLWRRSREVGRLTLPEPAFQPGLGMRWETGARFYGVTAAKKEGLAGHSGPEVLWLVDEASGIPEYLYEAIKGNLAGGAKLLLTSNSTQDSGTFFDAFNDHAELYQLITISAYDSPNVLYVDDNGAVPVPDDQIIPGVCTAEYINSSRIDYGPDWQNNPLYAVRVLADFPSQSAQSVVGAALVMAAGAGWMFAEFFGPLHIGLDVAHYGDDNTVAYPRRGYKTMPCKSINGNNEKQTSCMVVDMMCELWKYCEGDVHVKVDTGGGYGTEVCSRLSDPTDKCWTHRWEPFDDGSYGWVKRENEPPWKKARPPILVYEVNGAKKSTELSPDTGEPLYVNIRSQIWFGVEKWFKEGGTIPPQDKRLAKELIAPRYVIDKERKRVESKKELKKRLGGKSPDHADALTLCIYEPDNAIVDGSHSDNEYPDEWGGGRGY